MLRKIEFPRAEEPVKYMADGFPIVGQFPETDVLPVGYRAAIYNTTDLMNKAEETRKMVIATCRATDDADLDKELYNITEDEREKGWLVGPYATEDLDCTPGWSCSRRFGLRQGAKVRPIDDYSISLVNDTLEAQETIDPSDIDVIAANARLHADALVSDVAA